MLRIILIGFVLLVFASNLQADSMKQLNLDLSNAWFKPRLATNNEPKSCETFLNLYTQFFAANLAGNPLVEYDNADGAFVESITTDNPDFIVLVEGDFPFSEGEYSNYSLRETPETSKKYFSVLSERRGSPYTRSGEAYSFVVLAKSLSKYNLTNENYKSFIESHEIDSLLKISDDNNNYQFLYKNEKEPERYSKKMRIGIRALFGYKNNFYLVGSDENESLIIFRLVDEKNMNLACEIKINPHKEDLQHEMKKFPEFTSYQHTMGQMMDGGDSCAINPYASFVMDGFFQDALYRPWVSLDVTESASAGLERWGYSGIWNHHVYKDFKKYQRSATEELKQFYIKNYGINGPEALRLAESAVSVPLSTFYYADFKPEAAINLGYGNQPAGFYDIARMILDGASVADLKTKLKTIDQEIIKRGDFLFYSAERPDVTALLLDMGANANAANTQSYLGFGKTPLMYSAQYNQLETAKVLLKHGANSNAVTIKPQACGIKTVNMTPLHYAVRYASPAFIKLLLDNGAQSFVEAKDKEDSRKEKGETALDWLQRYTAANASQKNPNIPDDKVAEIEKWLQAPSADNLSSQVTEYILKGEKEYQSGNVSSAYNSLSLALQIEPGNEKALSDMSLIALKNGNLGVSLEASDKLIKNSKDDKIKATAWFNQGLACEKGERYLSYNGKQYCKYGFLHPLLKALAIEATDGRKNKFIDSFQKGTVSYCEIPYDGRKIKISFQYPIGYDDPEYNYETLYILHEVDLKIEPSDFSWDVNYSGNVPPITKHFEPTLAGTFSLDSKVTLSVLKNSAYLQFPYRLGDYVCKEPDSISPAVPVDVTQGKK